MRIVWHHYSSGRAAGLSRSLCHDRVGHRLRRRGRRQRAGLGRPMGGGPRSSRRQRRAVRAGAEPRRRPGLRAIPSAWTGRPPWDTTEVSPSLVASNVPAYQWVEIRAGLPPDLCSRHQRGHRRPRGRLRPSSPRRKLRRGSLDRRRAGRDRADLGLGFRAGSIRMAWAASCISGTARSPAVDYDREYEQEPPTDLKPAEVGALLTQGAVTEKEFTATMFDLIRQGAIKATPVTGRAVSTWGGLQERDDHRPGSRAHRQGHRATGTTSSRC